MQRKIRRRGMTEAQDELRVVGAGPPDPWRGEQCRGGATLAYRRPIARVAGPC